MKCTTGFNDNAVGIQFVPALRAKNSSTLALQTFNTSEGKKYYIKRLTPLEAFRFMGFDDEDYEKASKVDRLQEDDVDTDKSYLTLWDEKNQKIISAFGSLPPSYDESDFDKE